MKELRRFAETALIWTADRGFEIGGQIYRGWLLAFSDGEVRF
jgi:hypothetical protein